MTMHLLRATGIGTAIGALAVIGVYLLARATGEEFVVASPPSAEPAPLPWLAFVVAVVLQGGVGGFVLAALAGLTPRPRAVFVGVASVGLLLSFILPFQTGELSTGVWLSLTHVAAFAGIVPVVAGALPSHKQAKNATPLQTTES